MTKRLGYTAAGTVAGILLGYVVARELSALKLTTFIVYVLTGLAGLWGAVSPKHVSVLTLLLMPIQLYKQLGNVYVTNTFGLSLVAFLAVLLTYRRLSLTESWVAIPFTVILVFNAARGVDGGEATSLALAFVGALLLQLAIVTARPKLETAMAALVVSGTLFSLWHTVTYFSSQVFAFSDPYEQKRIVGDMVGNANILGIYLAAIAVLSLGFVLDRKLRSSVRLMALVAFGVNCMGTAVTLSRSAWFGLAVILVVLALRNFRSIGTLLLGLGSLVGVLTLLPNASFQVRVLSVLNTGSDEAIVDRLLGWKSAWLIIQEWPVIGVGFPNFRYKYYLFVLPGSKQQLIHAHNIFLTFWAELGLVGLSSFVFLIIAMIMWYRRVQPALKDYASVILGAVGVILAAGVTEYSFNGQHIVFLFYTLIGLYILTLSGSTRPLQAGEAT